MENQIENKTEAIYEMLTEVISDLKSLVEINKVQTEKLIENTELINKLFSRQFAMEKAIYYTLTPLQREQFSSIYESELKKSEVF